MAYYMGDYYRGDFWSKLGKGIKKAAKGIGKLAQNIAPVAGILLPAVGAATLVGRGVRAAGKVKQAGRDARALAAQFATPAQQSAPTYVTPQSAAVTEPGYHRATTYTPRSGARESSMAQAEHALWMASGSRIGPDGVPLIPNATTTATKRIRRTRAASYRRRKAAKKRTTTTTRRRRRRTRRRS